MPGKIVQKKQFLEEKGGNWRHQQKREREERERERESERERENIML